MMMIVEWQTISPSYRRRLDMSESKKHRCKIVKRITPLTHCHVMLLVTPVLSLLLLVKESAVKGANVHSPTQFVCLMKLISMLKIYFSFIF